MKKTLICTAIISALLFAFTSCVFPSGGNNNNSGSGSSGTESGNDDSGSTSSSSGSAVETEKIALADRVAADEGSYGTYKKPYSPGDLIFSDGSAIPVTSELTLTDEQKSHAIAVIFFVGKGLNSDDTGTQESRTLGVGLAHANDKMAWCVKAANGYNAAIEPLKCPSSGSAGSYVFSGDRNGSDNLSQMSNFLKRQSEGGVDDDTSTTSNYPAFYWAKNYKNSCTEVSGTDYEDGWYLPSIAELYGISKYLNYIDKAAGLCERSKFDKTGKEYWSSTTVNSATSAAYMIFGSSSQSRGSTSKNQSKRVCAIREF